MLDEHAMLIARSLCSLTLALLNILSLHPLLYMEIASPYTIPIDSPHPQCPKPELSNHHK